MPACRGTRLDGRPCGQQAPRGGGFCWHHDPTAPPRSPRCGICRHLRRAEIEAMLEAGARFPDVATPFRLSTDLVRYHRLRHMPPAAGEGGEG